MIYFIHHVDVKILSPPYDFIMIILVKYDLCWNFYWLCLIDTYFYCIIYKSIIVIEFQFLFLCHKSCMHLQYAFDPAFLNENGVNDSER